MTNMKMQFQQLISAKSLLLAGALIAIVACVITIPSRRTSRQSVLAELSDKLSFASTFSDLVFHHLSVRKGSELSEDLIEVVRYSNVRITSHDFEVFARLPRLLVLDLKGSTFNDADLLQLERCPELQVLILDDSSMNDACVSKLRGLQRITRLSVKNCGISDAAIIELTQIQSLREIAIGDRERPDNSELRSSAPRLLIVSEFNCFYGMGPNYY